MAVEAASGTGRGTVDGFAAIRCPDANAVTCRPVPAGRRAGSGADGPTSADATARPPAFIAAARRPTVRAFIANHARR